MRAATGAVSDIRQAYSLLLSPRPPVENDYFPPMYIPISQFLFIIHLRITGKDGMLIMLAMGFAPPAHAYRRGAGFLALASAAFPSRQAYFAAAMPTYGAHAKH